MKKRILFLSINGHQLLSGKKLRLSSPHESQLRHDINTDELYPIEAMNIFIDIADFVLTGDRTGRIKKGEIKKVSPHVLVAGHNFGCGSAREHPVIALKQSGVEMIFAHSFNKTFQENCLYLGIRTSTNLVHVERLISGKLRPTEILEELEEVEKEILEAGGLFDYNLMRIKGEVKPLKPVISPRPMTAVEKIIAKHSKGTNFVKPGDQLFVSVDFRMSYEVFTPLVAELLKNQAPDLLIKNPDSIILVADHFIEDESVAVKKLIKAQEEFAKKNKTVIYKSQGNKAQGICHLLMLQDHLLPGQLAAGTDSHSCMWGTVGALGIPVGATAMANAFLTGDILLTVPPTIKISFSGNLPKNCSARDVVMHLMTVLPSEKLPGAVLDFDIQNLDWSVDELSVLANQAKEIGALTSLMVPNKNVIDFLAKKRKLSKKKIEQMISRSDADADYQACFTVDLGKVEPMVALPGNPKNVAPINQLSPRPKITKAFIGSCVGGKLEDIKKATKVLKGRKIAKGVKLIVQPGSQEIYKKAQKNGWLEIVKKAGGQVCFPNCGGCIGQGPARVGKGETAIFASTRNYHGRTGEGKVYLASSETVVSSAIVGKICSLFDLGN